MLFFGKKPLPDKNPAENDDNTDPDDKDQDEN
jgi:hypothetical protein